MENRIVLPSQDMVHYMEIVLEQKVDELRIRKQFGNLSPAVIDTAMGELFGCLAWLQQFKEEE